MPTIKLRGGSFVKDGKRYTAQSEPFEVSEKIAKTLNCSVVEKPKPTLKQGKKYGAPLSE